MFKRLLKGKAHLVCKAGRVRRIHLPLRAAGRGRLTGPEAESAGSVGSVVNKREIGAVRRLWRSSPHVGARESHAGQCSPYQARRPPHVKKTGPPNVLSPAGMVSGRRPLAAQHP